MTCHELRIKNPEDVGEFCTFEAFMKRGSVGALRHAFGRKSNQDAVVVVLAVVVSASQCV